MKFTTILRQGISNIQRTHPQNLNLLECRFSFYIFLEKPLSVTNFNA